MANMTVQQSLKVEFKPNYNFQEWGNLCYAKAGDAGFDLRAAINSPVILQVNERVKVLTGCAFQVPDGFEMQVRPRSSLSSKGIDVAFGTVDSGFRGEVFVNVVNKSKEPYTIVPGEKIAQGVMAPIYRVLIEPVQSVSTNTDRGTGGSGSTGRL